jgi:hypothetical protein
VLAATGKDIKFELWLPDRWNGKYAQAGNGGLAGAINYPTMGGALAEGYATASTDLGHQSRNFFDSSWMVGQKPRIIDFAYRAHHLVGGSARKIIAAYYGRRPRHAYFVGCSSGGWQALTEAQKFPDDFAGTAQHDRGADVPETSRRQSDIRANEAGCGSRTQAMRRRGRHCRWSHERSDALQFRTEATAVQAG